MIQGDSGRVTVGDARGESNGNRKVPGHFPLASASPTLERPDTTVPAACRATHNGWDEDAHASSAKRVLG
jgi:hypothetical protein